MKAGGAFHAKIALFLGPRSARVIVGTHNLTMSGFGINREVTNVIEVQGKKDRDGAAAVQEVMSFSRAWADRLAPPLVNALDDLAVFAQPYQGPFPTARSVAAVGSRPDGDSLWDRVLPLLPKSANRVTVVGPFFDDKLSFVQRIRSDLQPDELVVGVDPASVSFPGKAALATELRLVDASQLCPGKNQGGYLHAKAILIESDAGRTLITGSANPTFAAWLAGPNARNAEMVVVRQLDHGDNDLGLGRLVAGDAVAPASIQLTAPHEEPSSPSSATIRLLVGATTGDSIVVDNPPAGIQRLDVLSAEGDVLSSTFDALPQRLVVRVPQIADAALLRLTTEGGLYHGWVHHVDALHQLALPSSQRRIRDALGGLGGDPSKLEQLLKMVEKVVFRGPSAEGHGRSGTKRETNGEDAAEHESRVVFVPTLRGDQAEGLRRLSSGDLGLLLDVLMRQLWRSLTHEEGTSTRSESELIDSDDEDLVEELPTDPRVAELWTKKTATLLRRLLRRVEEEDDKAQVVVECAAILGVLEAVRRVEDHDRWKKIRARFLDRDLAARFFIEAVPLLLAPETGVVDSASRAVGEDFAEREALMRWLTWLAWLSGFGHAELVAAQRGEGEAVEALAALGLLAARTVQWRYEEDRILELLEAAPRSGVRPDVWIEELQLLGRTITEPAPAHRARRPPKAGDLVVTRLSGKSPMFVREVRGNKVELVDFSGAEAKLVLLADRVEVLDPWTPRAATRSA
jgi:hypothetical protein